MPVACTFEPGACPIMSILIQFFAHCGFIENGIFDFGILQTPKADGGVGDVFLSKPDIFKFRMIDGQKTCSCTFITSTPVRHQERTEPEILEKWLFLIEIESAKVLAATFKTLKVVLTFRSENVQLSINKL
jgi:hypothetical protein